MEGVSDRLPKSQVTVKTVLTVCLTALGVLGAIYILIHGQVAVGLTLGSALIAVALNHAVDWLQKKHVRHGLAISGVMSALLLFFVVLGLLLIPPAVAQARELVKEAPALLSRARESSLYKKVNARLHLDEKLAEMEQKSPDIAQGAVDPALRAVGGVVAGVTAFVTVFFLVAFMLAFGGKLVNALLGEATPERRPRYERVVSKVYRSMGGYISGLSFICLVNAVCSTITFAILKIPFFLPLGILSGLSSLIPLAGNTLAGVVITIIALATVGVWKALAVGIFFIVYQQFENHLLGPVVYKRTVNVNPLVIIIALLFMAELFGVIGAVLAVPVVAAVQIIVREVLAFRREQLNLPAPPTAKALEEPATG